LAAAEMTQNIYQQLTAQNTRGRKVILNNDPCLFKNVEQSINDNLLAAKMNFTWLQEQMRPYFSLA